MGRELKKRVFFHLSHFCFPKVTEHFSDFLVKKKGLGCLFFDFLKDDPHLFTGGEKKADFFFHSKCKISGSECRSGFKLVLAHTMVPSGPFWGAHPTEKYVHPKAHPLRNFYQKKCRFWRFTDPFVPVGCKYFLGCTDPKNL